MTRGGVWWADLPRPWGRRPVLLVARDEAYILLTWIIVAPLTTTIRLIPSTVALSSATDGVPQDCVASMDNLLAIRKDWLDSPITRLSADRMREVDQAIHFALGLRH